MLYKIARAFFYLFFTICCRWEIEGLENIPKKGPVIVCANHQSLWDPIIVACLFQRQVHFMAKKELFHNPIFGFILRKLGTFPVNREHPDRRAVKSALDVLSKGQILGIFPEGKRNDSGELLSPLLGAAFFATRSGAPVCPIALEGTKKIFFHFCFHKFRVKIGPLIRLKKQQRSDLQLISSKIMDEIRKLLRNIEEKKKESAC